MSKELVRKVHANDKQIKFLRSRAKRKSFIGGRGSGKSTVMGMAVGVLFNHFARANWAMVGLNYVQLDLIVVPSIRDALSMMGLPEYNYMAFSKPPAPTPSINCWAPSCGPGAGTGGSAPCSPPTMVTTANPTTPCG